MKDLQSLISRYRSLAVVGLAKNVGKTVTVNRLIAESAATGLKLGLTSSGRDGEEFDIISALPKPAIDLPANTVVATATGSLERGSARLEILMATGIYNSLGEIVIALVREGGRVEVSGPSRVADLKRIIAILEKQTQLVIIDGAIDRVAASAVAQAVILATGAPVGPSPEIIIERTVSAARVLMTPGAKGLSQSSRELLEQGKAGVCNIQGDVKLLPFATLIDGPREIGDYLGEDFNCLLVGGALGDSLADLLMDMEAVPGLSLVIQDATRIFVGAQRWHKLNKLVKVRVAKPLNLVAITVNPVDPRGRKIDGEKVVAGLRQLMPELLVLDPLARGGCR